MFEKEMSYKELEGVWEEMKRSPENTIKYFKERFRMCGSFRFNPSLNGYGRTTILAYRGVFCKRKLGGLFFPCCIEMGKSAFEDKNHWLDLVLNMWHEECHQMVQPIMQFFTGASYFEVDAWQYSFNMAGSFMIDESDFRPQFRYWRNTMEGHL